jgi:hypothetical protein
MQGGAVILGRLAPLVVVATLGCAGQAVRVEPIEGPYTLEHAPAEWSQSLYIGNFDGYAPGEYCVGSDIRSADGSGYGMLVRVSVLGTTYMATGQYGDETETFSIRLRKGDEKDTLYADFEHTVERRGKPWLRFAGTTVLSVSGFLE